MRFVRPGACGLAACLAALVGCGGRSADAVAVRASGPTPEGMVWVPGATFLMGSDAEGALPRERPVHPVAVAGFWMDATEVTNRQFAAFVDATGYVTTAEQPSAVGAGEARAAGSLVFRVDQGFQVGDPLEFRRWWVWREGTDWRHPKGPGSDLVGREEHPVVHVSHDDARAYAAWAGKRLPTEDEWRQACETPEKRRYPWGAEFEPGRANISGDKDGFVRTAPVGSFPQGATAYGALDMGGNVWEWTTGGYSGYPGGPFAYEDYSRYVQRGGSWTNSDYNLRIANRSPQPPYITDANLGFRVVYSAYEPPRPVIAVPPRASPSVFMEDFDSSIPIVQIKAWWGDGYVFTSDAFNGWFAAGLRNLSRPTRVNGEYMAMIRRDTGTLFAPGDYVDVTVRVRYDRGDRDYARTSVAIGWGDQLAIEPGGRGADENTGYPWFLIANNSDEPEVWHEVTAHRLVWGEGALNIGFGAWGNLSDLAMPPIVLQHRILVDYVRIEHSACSSGPTDFDGDCDVDMSDFAFLQRCEAGEMEDIAAGCEPADLDGDGHVWWPDVDVFRACLVGEGVGMKPECVVDP